MPRMPNMLARTSSIARALGLLLIIVSKSLHAAGFANNDQSVTYLGNAYAGTASAAQDASTAYYNPAGMAELDYMQIVASTTYIAQDLKLYNATATNSLGDAITGNNPAKPQANLLLPAAHIAVPLTECFSVGLSFVEPFALDTNYSTSDIARLMATENKITAYDLSPSIAYKIFSGLSIGAGLDLIEIKTKISSSVAWSDSGVEANGYVINTGNKSKIGYHIGVLYKPWCNTQIGVAYFSGFNPKFNGQTQSFQTLDFNHVATATYTINFPARVNFGVTYEFCPELTLMAEGGWTHWSTLQTIVMNYNPANVVPGLKSFYYKNAWRASLGTDYKVAHCFTLKCGLAYDQSPAKKPYRSAMLPDTDQYMLAIGAKFTLNDQIAIVAGYMHVFYSNASIAENGFIDALNSSPNVDNLSTLNASVKNHADKFGVQLVLTFA